jgi:CheY-like chemotaxis protein/two-component sensor histidine kinase
MKATQAKNSFLSSTSHELRTPLNSILGFAQLLQLSELSEEDSDGVERILGAGRHLLALINELIDIARIESGDLGLSLEPVLVRPVIEECCQLMAPIAAERSIRIITDGAHPALAVFADRQRLAQVLVNLISNAVKYNHRDGSITISCAEEGTGQVSIVVTDTGPGLAPDDLERIFVPFERLGAERTAVEGTGIGLPLARALTEAMKGHLTVSSVLGQGAAFTVSLTRAPDLIHVPAPAPRQRHRRPGRTSGRSRPQRSLHRGQPGERRGGSPVPEGQAEHQAAVRDIWPGRPRVRHPGRARHHPARPAPARPAGEEVLNELKADPATAAIPVIVLSADASRGVIHRLLAGGAFAYLTKPIELAELGDRAPGCSTPAHSPASSRAVNSAFAHWPAMACRPKVLRLATARLVRDSRVRRPSR